MAMWDLCQQIGLTWHSNSVIHPVCRQDKPCGELGAQDRDDLTKPMFTSLFEIFFLSGYMLPPTGVTAGMCW